MITVVTAQNHQGIWRSAKENFTPRPMLSKSQYQTSCATKPKNPPPTGSSPTRGYQDLATRVVVVMGDDDRMGIDGKVLKDRLLKKLPEALVTAEMLENVRQILEPVDQVSAS
ncbi:hypothetical protein Droror1_Dr00022801 [Drosera rotundifolia]